MCCAKPEEWRRKRMQAEPDHFRSNAAKMHLRSRRTRVQVHRLTRRPGLEGKEEKDMDIELQNLKLYLENESILKQNEKLRHKALLLRQENLALLSEFHRSFPHLGSGSTAPCCTLNESSSRSTTTTTSDQLPMNY